MKTLILITIGCMLASYTQANDLEIKPVTKVSVKDGVIVAKSIPMNSVSSGFYIVRVAVNKTGSINLTGTAKYTGEGSVNVIMWSVVDGNSYFSKMPLLQGFSNRKGKKFSIPFHAKEKTITEVKLAVDFLSSEGEIEITDLKLD